MENSKSFSLSSLSQVIKYVLILFVSIQTIGFSMGLKFVHLTTGGSPGGVHSQYLGNEEQADSLPEGTSLKFKKSEGEILTLVHNHLLSMSVIFLISAILLFFTDLSPKLKPWFMLEPLLSLFLTFGGIYLMSKGFSIMRYLVMFSGAAMTFFFLVGQAIVLKDLVKR